MYICMFAWKHSFVHVCLVCVGTLSIACIVTLSNVIFSWSNVFALWLVLWAIHTHLQTCIHKTRSHIHTHLHSCTHTYMNTRTHTRWDTHSRKQVYIHWPGFWLYYSHCKLCVFSTLDKCELSISANHNAIMHELHTGRIIICIIN